MKHLGRLALGLLPFFSSVLAQASTAFTDPVNGITFQAYTSATDGGKLLHNSSAFRYSSVLLFPVTLGLVFPPTGSTGATATEFVVEIIAPVTAGWVGLSLGGAMISRSSLLAS